MFGIISLLGILKVVLILDSGKWTEMPMLKNCFTSKERGMSVFSRLALQLLSHYHYPTEIWDSWILLFSVSMLLEHAARLSKVGTANVVEVEMEVEISGKRISWFVEL